MPDGVGVPQLGGPYTLVDHFGIPTPSSHFHGRFVLIYFGFTFCPDICPAELERMARVLDILGPFRSPPIDLTCTLSQRSVAMVRSSCSQ